MTQKSELKLRSTNYFKTSLNSASIKKYNIARGLQFVHLSNYFRHVPAKKKYFEKEVRTTKYYILYICST